MKNRIFEEYHMEKGKKIERYQIFYCKQIWIHGPRIKFKYDN